MHLISYLNPLLIFDERTRWGMWFPVFMALGSYMSMQGGVLYLYFFLFILFLFCVSVFVPSSIRGLFLIPCLGTLLGFGSCDLYQRLNKVQSLDEQKYVSSFEGTIQESDETSYGKRFLIAVKESTQKKLKKNIGYVRLTHRIKQQQEISVGDDIQTTVVLTPFSGPLFESGFDFKKNNNYQGIGASGYTVKPIRVVKHELTGWSAYWQQKRANLTKNLLSVPYENPQMGAIASALITGQKGMLHESTREAFAASGLAHVLAISGLHMNLMGVVIFIFIRLVFCRFPWILERVHLPKISAFLTFLGLIIYLMVSGQAVSALRAFIMASFVLWGVILGREGISMRFVALAASIILILKPYSFQLPSFQMSFFVVMALVAFYESYVTKMERPNIGRFGQFFEYVKGLLISSVLASLVVLPFSVYHFHTISLQGVLANLIVIPMLGVIVLPGLLIGIFLKMMLGIEGALQGVYFVIEGGYSLAFQIKQWPGAMIHMPHPPVWTFLLCIFGLLWSVIWQQKWRFLGIFFAVLGLVLMFRSVPPACFDAPDKNVYVCCKNGGVYTNAKRISTFTIKYLAHAMGVSEKDLIRTKLSKQELFQEH